MCDIQNPFLKKSDPVKISVNGQNDAQNVDFINIFPPNLNSDHKTPLDMWKRKLDFYETSD